MVSGGKEEEVFWVFKILAESPKYHLKSIFDRNFTLVRLLIHFYNKAMLKFKCKKINEHFSLVGIPDSLWLHKWFITIILMDFPFGSALRIWDNFLTDGIIFLVKFICVLIKTYEKEVIKMDLEKFALFLKTFCDEISEINTKND